MGGGDAKINVVRSVEKHRCNQSRWDRNRRVDILFALTWHIHRIWGQVDKYYQMSSKYILHPLLTHTTNTSYTKTRLTISQQQKKQGSNGKRNTVVVYSNFQITNINVHYFTFLRGGIFIFIYSGR